MGSKSKHRNLFSRWAMSNETDRIPCLVEVFPCSAARGPFLIHQLRREESGESCAENHTIDVGRKHANIWSLAVFAFQLTVKNFWFWVLSDTSKKLLDPIPGEDKGQTNLTLVMMERAVHAQVSFWCILEHSDNLWHLKPSLLTYY